MDFIPRISYGDGPTVVAFEFPPENDPFGEEDRIAVVKVVAATGVKQVNGSFVETDQKLKMNFVSEDIKRAFQTFFREWGWLGKNFNYYPHSDTDDGAAAWTIEDEKITYNRVMPGDVPGEFQYSFEFNLRRVVT